MIVNAGQDWDSERHLDADDGRHKGGVSLRRLVPTCSSPGSIMAAVAPMRAFVPCTGSSLEGLRRGRTPPRLRRSRRGGDIAGRRAAGQHHGGGHGTRPRGRCGRAGTAALPVRHGGDGAVGVRPGADVGGGVGERAGRCRAARPDGYQAADGAGCGPQLACPRLRDSGAAAGPVSGEREPLAGFSRRLP